MLGGRFRAATTAATTTAATAAAAAFALSAGPGQRGPALLLGRARQRRHHQRIGVLEEQNEQSRTEQSRTEQSRGKIRKNRRRNHTEEEEIQDGQRLFRRIHEKRSESIFRRFRALRRRAEPLTPTETPRTSRPTTRKVFGCSSFSGLLCGEPSEKCGDVVLSHPGNSKQMTDDQLPRATASGRGHKRPYTEPTAAAHLSADGAAGAASARCLPKAARP